MENTKILIDSTILVDFLRKQNKTKSELWKLKEKYTSLAISSITVFELYAGATSEKKITDVVLLLKWFDIIDFTQEVAELCGRQLIELKRTNDSIDYRDLFIGVTAVFFDLELATLNTKHFKKIPDLKLLHDVSNPNA